MKESRRCFWRDIREDNAIIEERKPKKKMEQETKKNLSEEDQGREAEMAM